MAERYITHPFIVKLNENEEYENLVNFNGLYFVAIKRNDDHYLYVTIDTYKALSYKELLDIENNESYTYGEDYIFSQSLRNEIPLDYTSRKKEIIIYWAAATNLLSFENLNYDISLDSNTNEMIVAEHKGSELFSKICDSFDSMINAIAEHEDFKYTLKYNETEVEYTESLYDCFTEIFDNTTLTQRDLVNKTFILSINSNDEYDVTVEYSIYIKQDWNIDGDNMINDIIDTINQNIVNQTGYNEYKIKLYSIDINDKNIILIEENKNSYIKDTVSKSISSIMTDLFKLDDDLIIDLYNNSMNAKFTKVDDTLLNQFIELITSTTNPKQEDLVNTSILICISSQDNTSTINYILDIKQGWLQDEEYDTLNSFIQTVVDTYITGENQGVKYYDIVRNNNIIDLNMTSLDSYCTMINGTGLIRALRMIVAGSTTIPAETDQNKIKIICDSDYCEITSSKLNEYNISYAALTFNQFVTKITACNNPKLIDLVGKQLSIEIYHNDIEVIYTININNGDALAIKNKFDDLVNQYLIKYDFYGIIQYITDIDENTINVNITNADRLLSNTLIEGLVNSIIPMIDDSDKILLIGKDNIWADLYSAEIIDNTKITYAENELINFFIKLTGSNSPKIGNLIGNDIELSITSGDGNSIVEYQVKFNKAWDGDNNYNIFVHNALKNYINGGTDFSTSYQDKELYITLNNQNSIIYDSLLDKLILFFLMLITEQYAPEGQSDFNSLVLTYNDYQLPISNSNYSLLKTSLIVLLNKIGVSQTSNYDTIANKTIVINISSNVDEFADTEYNLNFLKGYMTEEDKFEYFVNNICKQESLFNVSLNDNIISIKADAATTFDNIQVLVLDLIKHLSLYDDSHDYSEDATTTIGLNMITNNSTYSIHKESSLTLINSKVNNMFDNNIEKNYSSIFDIDIKLVVFINDINNMYHINVVKVKTSVSSTVSLDSNNNITNDFVDTIEAISGVVTTSDIDGKDLDDIVLPKRKETWLPDLILNLTTFNSAYFDQEATEDANKMVLDYYEGLNEYEDKDFTDEELASFCATFCKIILDLTQIEDIDELSSTDKIYKMVLNFYANEGTDDTLEAFNLLSSLYTTTTSSSCSSSSSCSNLVSSTTTSTTTCDCASQYKQYLATTLKSMLGNVDFYKSWFATINDGEYNEELCDILIKLIDEFVDEGYDLSFESNTLFSCPAITSESSKCNYQILENYKNVLEWTKEGAFKSNTNKIKSIGQLFGELLPNLLF